MRRELAAFGCGVLFGLGLTTSQMVNPAKVLNFLDFLGTWDPTLAFVLAGATGTMALLRPFILRRKRPLLDERFHLPQRKEIDRNLILGAAIFGVGWGLAGFCPAPPVAALVTLHPKVVIFLAGMVGGFWLYRRYEINRSGR